MSQITPYVFERSNIRVLGDGAGSFEVVAKDVVEGLGATWNGAAAIAHVPDEWKGVRSVLTPGGAQEMATLSESGLYFYLGRSDKAAALPMQKWVAGEVLPSIRKTGGYSVAMTPGELALAQAQAVVALERQHAAMQLDITEVKSRVDDLAESRVWDHCPQNCEPISKIRARMNERFGLPKEIVDLVVWRLPLSPKPAGMVRNQREEAQGSQYAVYAVADITRVFDRFVSECVRETAVFWSHRDVPKRFQLLPSGKLPKPLRAHLAQEGTA